jgi:predicted nucleic acid-binding protein
VTRRDAAAGGAGPVHQGSRDGDPQQAGALREQRHLHSGRAGDPAGSERVFRRFLRAVDVLPLTRPIMRRFARRRGDLRRGGQLIGDPDVLIAATALPHDLTLVTGNRAHFRRIPELRLHPTG